MDINGLKMGEIGVFLSAPDPKISRKASNCSIYRSVIKSRVVKRFVKRSTPFEGRRLKRVLPVLFFCIAGIVLHFERLTERQPYTANNMDEAVAHGRSNGWPGYIGSPRLATASYGAQAMRFYAGETTTLALSILDGLDERTVTRLSVVGYKDKATADILSDAAKHWATIERRQNEWMRSNGIK